MSTETKHWTHRFPQGETVQFLDESGDPIQLQQVFTQGDDYLHFLVSPDEAVYERLKFDNRISLRSLNTYKRLEGRLSLVDHRPSFYDTAISDNGESAPPDRRLVKFEADQTELGQTSEDDTVSVPERISILSEVLHLRSLPATIVPILLGLIYAAWMGWPISEVAASLAFAGGVLLHVASNLHNELSDYHHALMENLPIHNNPINKNRLRPSRVWSGALILYGVSLLAGFPILLMRGGNFLAIGVVGFLIASFYSLHRHTTTNDAVLRDLLMFVLMGPLMAVASSIAVSGHWDLKLCLVSVPIGFFVALILHEHEIYNIPIDRRAGATTLAILLGFHGSKLYYGFLVFSGYAAIGVMTLTGFIPYWTMLSYLTLPYAIYNLKLLGEIKSPLNPKMVQLRYSTAVLHLIFGLFYLAGFLTEVYF